MADPSISAVFKRPFAEQLAFFRAKMGNLLPSQRWDDVWKSAHDTGFMVAGATKADLLADFAGAVEKAIATGTSLGEFRKDFDNIVAKHGWSYTGERNWRSRVIYQTNISTSYAAGREAQITAADFPFKMYKHSDSVMHPRPLHQSWDGLTLPVDHPFWTTHSAPNGWGCKCRIIGIRNQAAARRLGGKWGQEPPAGWDDIDAKTGEPVGIDKGWGYQPGASVLPVQKQIKDKAEKLPEQLGAALKAAAPPDNPYALPPYKAAKTVKEAERLAQKIVDSPGPVAYQPDQNGNPLVRFAHGGISRRQSRAAINDEVRQKRYHKANYSGMDLETANAVNQALIQLQETCDTLGIPRLRGVKTGAGRALASMGDGVLSLSKNLKLNPLGNAQKNINTSPSSAPLKDKPFTTDGYFQEADDRLKTTLWHEFGHHIHQQFKVASEIEYLSPPLEKKLVEFTRRNKATLVIPSRYAATNSKEFFAESYSLYRLNRKDLIDPDFLTFIDQIERGAMP